MTPTDCGRLGHVSGGKFCTRCGTPLTPNPQPQTQTGLPRWLKIVLIVSGVMLGLGVLATLFGEEPASDPAATPRPTPTTALDTHDTPSVEGPSAEWLATATWSPTPTEPPTPTFRPPAEVKEELEALIGPIATPTSPSPTNTAVLSDRCSLTPGCHLQVANADLLGRYSEAGSEAGFWDFEEHLGEGLGEGKHIFNAYHKTQPYYVTWIAREGVGVQLVEMIVALPDGCNFLSAGIFVERELDELLYLVIPEPWQSAYDRELYGVWCYLYDNPALNERVSVMNDVVVKMNYLTWRDEPSAPLTEVLAVAFWPCGKKSDGTCQWTRS